MTRARRSALAYLWAAPVSVAGLVVAPFFARRRVVEGVLVCEGAAWPRRLGWRYTAITLGHVVLSTIDLDDALLTHEMVHVRQYERWGPFFVVAYALASLWAMLTGGRAYEGNRFERDARGASVSRR